MIGLKLEMSYSESILIYFQNPFKFQVQTINTGKSYMCLMHISNLIKGKCLFLFSPYLYGIKKNLMKVMP